MKMNWTIMMLMIFLTGSNDEVLVVVVDDVAVVDVAVDDFDVSRFIFVRRFWNHTLICKRKRYNFIHIVLNRDFQNYAN